MGIYDFYAVKQSQAALISVREPTGELRGSKSFVFFCVFSEKTAFTA